MKKSSTMFITQRLNHEYQSSFLRSIVSSFDGTYRNEIPCEFARKSILQFAGSFDIIPTKGICKVETFAN